MRNGLDLIRAGRNKPRIAFYLVSLGVGGAQKVASFVMNALVDEGYLVDVIVYKKEQENVVLSDKVVRHYLGIEVDSEDSTRVKLSKKLNAIRRYMAFTREICPDCAILFGPDVLACVALPLAGFHGKTMICERGCLSSKSAIVRHFVSRSMKQCDLGVFQSEGAFLEYGDNLPPDVRVIPNPCFVPIGVRRDSKKIDRLHIVSAGRFVPEKGFDCLIRAFHRISDWTPEARLTIYGDGAEREKLESLITELGLAGKVILPGSIRDIGPAIANAGVFVLSSEYEGLPNSLIEAMVLGVPVVSTDCRPGGARYLTKEGVIGGPIVPLGNYESLASAILRMLASPDEAEKIGQLGTQIAVDFAPEAIRQKWVSAIASLVGSSDVDMEDANAV